MATRDTAKFGGPWTPTIRRDGRTRMTVKRCCDGCGNKLRDVTEAEIEAAINGDGLPSIVDECPTCRPNDHAPVWVTEVHELHVNVDQWTLIHPQSCPARIVTCGGSSGDELIVKVESLCGIDERLSRTQLRRGGWEFGEDLGRYEIVGLSPHEDLSSILDIRALHVDSFGPRPASPAT